MLSLEDIKVDIPVPMLAVTELEYTQTVNMHGKAVIKGIVAEEHAQMLEQITAENCSCKITGDSKVLFSGTPSSFSLECRDRITYLTVELISHTARFHEKRRRKSFQDVSMSYGDVMKQAGKASGGSVSIDQSKDAKPHAPIIQYDETDWELLLRLSSYCGSFLVPDCTGDKPSVHMGHMGSESRKMEVDEYSIRKDMTAYHLYKENESGSMEQDFIVVQTGSLEDYGLGKKITCLGTEYVITEKTGRIVDGTLHFQYKLQKEKGIVRLKQYNPRIGGVSIKGKVLEIVQGYKLKLHLEIDKEQSKPKAYAYECSTPYQASGDTGWYFMPEVGETVYLYIADKDEQKAYVTMVEQKAGENSIYTSDPTIAYAGIPGDTEFSFRQDDILQNVKDNETYVWMPTDKGFVVQSKGDIHLHAKGDMKLNAAKINVHAGKVVNLCKGSKSIIVDSVINVKG